MCLQLVVDLYGSHKFSVFLEHQLNYLVNYPVN